MDYATVQKKAQTKIHAKGGVVRLTRTPPSGTYNPTAGVAPTPGTPAVSNVFALEIEADAQHANMLAAGTVEFSQLRTLMISALDLPSGLNQLLDVFNFENGDWKIGTYDVLAPDPSYPILYTVTVMR